MAACQYKVGYLSLKGCGDPAIAQCSFCNQAVCVRHMRNIEAQSACLSCYVERSPDQGREEEAKRQEQQQQQQQQGQHDDELERERMRRDSYDHYGYSHSSYRSRSYSTFDNRGRASAAAAAPLAAGDFQDS